MFMWNKKQFLFWIALSSLSLQGIGQSDVADQRKGEFRGLLRAGLCTSQINGDGFGGYNKLNGTAGVGVFTPISDKLRFQIELSYCGRGSRKRPSDDDPTSYRISAHYIDIPLLLKFDVWKFEFEAGLCNGIFLFHTEDDNFGRVPTDQRQWSFNRYEIAANGGIYVPINEKWKTNARFHYSILPAAGGFTTAGNVFFLSKSQHNTITLGIQRVLISR